MELNLDLAQSLGLAVIALVIGAFLKNRIPFLTKYFIPTPVIGGLVIALIILVGYQTNSFTINIDQSITPLLLVLFFTATGFSFSVKDLKKTGIIGLKLGILIIVLMFIQNGLSPLLAMLTGIDPLLALTMGSMSLTGGPGTSAAFGPTLESIGIENATLVALSASTFGLVMGSLIGGPVAKFLMKRNKVKPNEETSEIKFDETDETDYLDEKSLMSSMMYLLLAMGLGTILVYFLNMTGFVWPDYVGGLFIAAILRNILDAMNIKLNLRAINLLGTMSLSLFLALTIMDLEVWQLFNLALPMIIILAIQTVVVMLFGIFVIYKVMGKNYDAVVMSSGISGVGLGSTPNAVANMEAVIEENGPSPNSMIILPVIVAVVLSATNPIVITIFINLL
jgi:ESS family glutamate:Na+ symporter